MSAYAWWWIYAHAYSPCEAAHDISFILPDGPSGSSMGLDWDEYYSICEQCWAVREGLA
jgi:hypothetical protein